MTQPTRLVSSARTSCFYKPKAAGECARHNDVGSRTTSYCGVLPRWPENYTHQALCTRPDEGLTLATSAILFLLQRSLYCSIFQLTNQCFSQRLRSQPWQHSTSACLHSCRYAEASSTANSPTLGQSVQGRFYAAHPSGANPDFCSSFRGNDLR